VVFLWLYGIGSFFWSFAAFSFATLDAVFRVPIGPADSHPALRFYIGGVLASSFGIVTKWSARLVWKGRWRNGILCILVALFLAAMIRFIVPEF